MNRMQDRIALPLLMIFMAATLSLAQQPNLTNGNLQLSSAATGLDAILRQIAGTAAGPVWIGYAVPLIDSPKPRTICCGNYSSGENSSGCCGGCALESDNYGNSRSGACIQDTPQTHLVVFLRYSSGQVTRVRAMTPNCLVDAGGLTVQWLSDVLPSQSVDILTGLAQGKGASSEHYVVDSAIMSIALHADESSDAALSRLVAADQPEKTREKTAFWLAVERGRPGFLLLQQLAREDASGSFRSKLAFDLSLTHEPDAIQELIRMVHQDSDSHTRSQALFWLAQKAGKKAAGEITNAIENDPDTEVKKKAVFALSQMHDEGITKLIEVARTNRNREVRREAIFWLGQSHDPRGLAFIEEVLNK